MVAVGADVCISAHQHAEVAVVRTHLADALRSLVIEEEAIAVALDGGRGKEVDEALADADRPGARATTAMRRREGLVQVEVDDVEAHVARARHPDQSVEVCAVVVDERTSFVREVRDLHDVLLENAERVRVGQHHGRDSVIQMTREILDVDGAVVVALHRHDLETARRGGGGIGAVRGVGDEHACASNIAAVGVVRLDHAQTGPLAVRACRRLQRHPRHARDRRRACGRAPTSTGARPAHRPRPGTGCSCAKPSSHASCSSTTGLYFIVQRAERVHPLMEVVIAPREPSEVAREHGFRNRRNSGRCASQAATSGIAVSPPVAGTPAAVTAGPVA